MYEMITLKECKTWLHIDDTNTDSDTMLNYMIDWVTKFIETYINKQVITRPYTEFQDGDKQRNMLTRFYPIYSIESLHDDPDHDYGNNELIAVDDYRIYYDHGEVKLTDDEYAFFKGQQNIKVVYRAGFSRYQLVDEANNYIDIKESTSGTDFAVEIDPPSVPVGKFQGYDAEGLATAIAAALNADANLTLEYAVAYNQANKRFTFSSGTDFDLKWSTGASTAKSMAGLLGFSTSTDTNDGTSHASSSTDAYTGVPDDLKIAALSILDFLFNESAAGKGHLSEKRQALPHGEGTMEFIKEIPKTAKNILDSYAGAV
jgi:hypothetical protein